MKFTKIAAAPLLGLTLTLAACAGASEDDAAGDDAATEETAAEDAEAGDAGEHAHDQYAVDQTGEFSNEVMEGGIDGLNDRLAAHHAESAHDVHVQIVDTTGEVDADAAAQSVHRGEDAMILIAAGDQQIGVYGEGIDESEGEAISQAMVDAFDNDDFTGGIDAGISAASDALNN
ncbi:MAG: hypothetical protein HKN78_11420 [Sphingomonadaceae bacterium]|nr:hypothetical protein [Sphingomonadaceae bacterium]